MEYWKNYIENKKKGLCNVADVLIKGRDARRCADEVAGLQKGGNDGNAKINIEGDEDSDSEGSDPKGKLIGFITRRGTYIGAGFMQTDADKDRERLDGMLSDTILQKVPKELRAAIINLNENKDLSPGMVLSGVKVHMF